MDDLFKKVNTLTDFVISKRFDNSLEKVLEKYPEGCTNRLIASLLGLKEEEIEDRYQEIIKNLKTKLDV